MSHDSGTSTKMKPNTLLQKLQQQIIAFIRKLQPGHKTKHGVRYCGNITVFDGTIFFGPLADKKKAVVTPLPLF